MVLLGRGALAIESKQPNYAKQEVFHGWKDIAQYLRIGVRTAQRYERELGLPVRRPSGHRPGSVVAIKSELDSWLKSSPTERQRFDASQRAREVYLPSEIAKRLQERAELQGQMISLRNELKTNMQKMRESISKVRQQLNETRKQQDAIAAAIQRYSKMAYGSVRVEKQRKPN